jgi:ABC-type transport system involved in cytochrome bd biosynthesis fused ATPase/permease subunit
MDVDKLKLEIIAKIIASDDVELLNRIQEIIDAYKSNSFVNEPSSTYQKTTSENIRVFNESEQKRIDKALEQYKNGECISDEEADKEIQKWLED